MNQVIKWNYFKDKIQIVDDNTNYVYIYVVYMYVPAETRLEIVPCMYIGISTSLM
jgi:hypothetical protein